MGNNNLYAVLMAGGQGERLWPCSRKEKPKQFLAIGAPRSLIQETYRRVRLLVPPERILVVTGIEQVKLVSTHLPELPRENILAEPMGRNTAACLGLSAIHIHSRNKDANLIILPADHIIKNDSAFKKNILTAARFAEAGDYLVTLGIKPTYPSTGYGYIKVGNKYKSAGIFKVDEFVEKPGIAVAGRYLKSGKFLWNSGMFAFKATTLLSAIENHMPDLYSGLQKISRAMNRQNYIKTLSAVYSKLPKISIDYGVMEKSDNVYICNVEFIWDDVGSWDALRRIIKPDKDGNVSTGKVIMLDTKDSILVSEPGHLIATMGISDLIVIHTKTSTLVCPRACADNIKSLVGKLK
ncbi:MAG: mannose-1-phosphate guanylyltransferase [Candidatus Omnitrophica bacterium]|nr:mannose-1-phosphate guanylyltransferase [Candidatus Omnitrophota bacterium]